MTEIDVPLLNEKPYIDLTLSYLKAQGVSWESAADYSYFRISGGSFYKPVDGLVSGDFSSAAFPLCAAVVSGGQVTFLGLDPEDPQGDKAVFAMLSRMGCDVTWSREGAWHHEGAGSREDTGNRDEWHLTVSRKGPLKGGTFDLNDTPDLLPVMAVLGAYAEGETALVNVAHARIKETDRIAVMARELGKLGAAIREKPDGLVIRGGGLRGGTVDGQGDHRVVMAMAVAALGADGPVEIAGAESAAVTYPAFPELMGASITG
jgi:3-phosphoshikimate 1-carboxyvinyltransferase